MQNPLSNPSFDCIQIELDRTQLVDQSSAENYVAELLAQALLWLDDPQTEAWTVEPVAHEVAVMFVIRPLHNTNISIRNTWRLTKELRRQPGVKSARLLLRD